MKDSQIQVEESHYLLSYDTKGRFASYWHQIREVSRLLDNSNKTVLDVGIGNTFFSSYLEKNNIDVATVDIDLKLKPKIVGSILYLPFKDKSFDIVTCFQIMEHLPFESFYHILEGLYRITKKHLVFSIPDRSLFFNLHISIYPIRSQSISFTIPSLFQQKHIFNGEHYWEIGRKNYSLNKVKRIITTSGFEILNNYRVPEKPIHHMFILKVT